MIDRNLFGVTNDAATFDAWVNGGQAYISVNDGPVQITADTETTYVHALIRDGLLSVVRADNKRFATPLAGSYPELDAATTTIEYSDLYGQSVAAGNASGAVVNGTASGIRHLMFGAGARTYGNFLAHSQERTRPQQPVYDAIHDFAYAHEQLVDGAGETSNSGFGYGLLNNAGVASVLASTSPLDHLFGRRVGQSRDALEGGDREHRCDQHDRRSMVQPGKPLRPSCPLLAPAGLPVRRRPRSVTTKARATSTGPRPTTSPAWSSSGTTGRPWPRPGTLFVSRAAFRERRHSSLRRRARARSIRTAPAATTSSRRPPGRSSRSVWTTRRRRSASARPMIRSTPPTGSTCSPSARKCRAPARPWLMASGSRVIPGIRSACARTGRTGPRARERRSAASIWNHFNLALTFDTTTITGLGAGQGFEWFDNGDGNSVTVTNAAIIDSTTVDLTLSAVPTGTGGAIDIGMTGAGNANSGPTTGNRATLRTNGSGVTTRGGRAVEHFICIDRVPVI